MMQLSKRVNDCETALEEIGLIVPRFRVPTSLIRHEFLLQAHSPLADLAIAVVAAIGKKRISGQLIFSRGGLRYLDGNVEFSVSALKRRGGFEIIVSAPRTCVSHVKATKARGWQRESF